jgi:hypothetical protein
MASAAQKQGMVSEPTTSSLDFSKVMEAVQVSCGAWNKLSLKFIAACSTAFLVGAFATDDKQRRKMDQVQDELKVLLRGANIGKSQTYNYIATALALARAISKNKANGVFAGFLAAKTERAAIEGIEKAIHNHTWIATGKPDLAWSQDGDGGNVFSIDVLRVNLGLDKLVKFKADNVTPRKIGGANRRGGRGGSSKEATATQAAPASVIKRLTDDTELQSHVPAETVVGMATTVVGRVEMVKRLISLMTLEELTECQKGWKAWHADRSKVLANENKAEKDKASSEEAPREAATA